MEDLVARVRTRLAGQGRTLAVAESCTGGLLSARLTDREGASEFFLAGLTTYSNDSKVRLLGVPGSVLAAYGAVSEPVVRAMATGAREATGATTSLAITGIAGPGGGSVEKPVGTVWVAASVGDRMDARECRFSGDRAAIREESVRTALAMLDSLLETA